jgi:hypothetical protein
MLFGHNYFNVRMNGKKVKIDTDKTEFTVTVKNGKATFNVEAEPIVTDECSDYCDCCPGCDEIKEVIVEDNKPNTININITKDGDDKPKTKKKTLDTVC